MQSSWQKNPWKYLRVFLVAFAVLILCISVANANERLQKMHDEMLYPSVKIVPNPFTVGSGTIVYSGMREGKWANYVLTNWHVVQSNIATNDGKETREMVEVETFRYNDLGAVVSVTTHEADIVYHDQKRDMALLRLREQEKGMRHVAVLMVDEPRIFETVYNVGAGLGFKHPFPTRGMFSSREGELNKLPAYLVSSPAISGNSGGGSFRFNENLNRYEMIGMVTAVAMIRSGMMSSSPIIHMVIVVPINSICSRLGEHGYGFICEVLIETP